MARSEADLILCKEQAVLNERLRDEPFIDSAFYSAFAENEEWKRKRITNEWLREDAVLRDEAKELRKARLCEDIEFKCPVCECGRWQHSQIPRARVTTYYEDRVVQGYVKKLVARRVVLKAEAKELQRMDNNAPTLPDGDAHTEVIKKRPRGKSEPKKCPVCECGCWWGGISYYEDRVMQGYIKKLVARRVVLKAEATELLRIDRKAYADAIAFLEARGLRAGPEMRVAGKRKRQLSKAL